MPFLPLPLPFCRFVDFLPLPLNMVHFVPSNPVRTLYYYPSVLPPKPVSWCCFGIYLTGVPVAGSASWWPGQHSLSLRCDSGEQQQQRWRHATGTIIKPIVEKHVQSQRINKPRICSRESIFYAPKYSPPEVCGVGFKWSGSGLGCNKPSGSGSGLGLIRGWTQRLN